MAIEIRRTSFGPPAAAALRAAIDEAQAADRLAPVTVVVPRPTVGLAARRQLARGGPDGAAGRRGLVNVQFVTAGRLAADLGGNRLAAEGRAPCTAAVLAGAARTVLASLPEGSTTVLWPVRDHPSTVRALCSAYRDLRDVPEATLGRLAATSARAGDVVRLIGAMRRRLAPWYDEVDVAEAATAAVAEVPPGARRSWGRVVVYLPLGLPRHHLRLLAALGDDAVGTDPLVVLVGLARPADAPADPLDDPDATARELIADLRRLGARVVGAPPSAPAPTATEVLSAPSADAEVLTVLRMAMTAHRDGLPLDRMAIAHGGQDPYPRLLAEALTEAGIPHNGPGVRSLAATLPGRVLLGLLAVADAGWRRPDVIAWLSTGPVLDGGRPVPAGAWDRVSRQAGVIAGTAEWAERLDAFARAQRGRLADDPELRPGGGQEWRREHVEWEIEAAGRLAAFVAALAARCAERPRSWAGWVAWARAVLADHLGDARRRAEWGRAEEVEAFTAIEEAMGQLVALDRFELVPSQAEFRSALDEELSRPAPQTTRFGRGILVGEISELVGLDLDQVFIIGVNDGAFPAVVRDDARPARPRAGGGRPRGAAAHQGPGRRRPPRLPGRPGVGPRRVLSFPRDDQHGGRVLRPSRWLLGRSRRSSHRRPAPPAGLEDLGDADGYRIVVSYQDALASASSRPPSPTATCGACSVDRGPARWPATPWWPTLDRLRAGFDGQARAARPASPGSTGSSTAPACRPLAGHRPAAVGDRAWRPTPPAPAGTSSARSCESTSPGARGNPAISAQDRGLLVHRVLERYVGAAIEGRPTRTWPTSPRGLRRVRGRGAAPAARCSGRLDRAGILRDLRAFVREDRRFRPEPGCRPVAVELAFGMPDDPVEVELDGGQRACSAARSTGSTGPATARLRGERLQDREADRLRAVADRPGGAGREAAAGHLRPGRPAALRRPADGGGLLVRQRAGGFATAWRCDRRRDHGRRFGPRC